MEAHGREGDKLPGDTQLLTDSHVHHTGPSSEAWAAGVQGLERINTKAQRAVELAEESDLISFCSQVLQAASGDGF